MADVRVYDTPMTLALTVAQQFRDLAEQAIAARGRFVVALAGGSTPKNTYDLLARDFANTIDWHFVQFFWGDERTVPPDHHDNNARMARETLLDHVRVPLQNIHRIKGELEPQAAADDYEALLRDFFKTRMGVERARFDLVLLGMGKDGHTASLFPGTAAIHQQERWVVAHHVESMDTWRITLTPVALNAATRVMFVVAGEDKAETLKQVLEGEEQPDVYPSQIIKPSDGQLQWLVDREAASLLTR
ncbi:MAG: 6-phosphogluconolactonase [Chloroflexi bacterium]|nr:6-phosphogluconolactonase [Chloroflexota bacterium]